MQRNQPEAYNELAGCLSGEEQQTLQGNFVKAHEQWIQCKFNEKRNFSNIFP